MMSHAYNASEVCAPSKARFAPSQAHGRSHMQLTSEVCAHALCLSSSENCMTHGCKKLPILSYFRLCESECSHLLLSCVAHTQLGHAQVYVKLVFAWCFETIITLCSAVPGRADAFCLCYLTEKQHLLMRAWPPFSVPVSVSVSSIIPLSASVSVPV